MAATAPSPPAPANPPTGQLTSAGSALTWPAAGVNAPSALMTPVVYAPYGLVAPSYAGWLTQPPQQTLPGTGFTSRRLVVAEIETFQTVAVAPPASAIANAAPVAEPPSGLMGYAAASPDIPSAMSSAVSSAIPVSAPLPPKRLAVVEGRIVLASLGPLPPRREVAPAPSPVASQAKASPAEEVAAVADDAAELEAEAPQEDAARPIDDTTDAGTAGASADRAPPHIETLIRRHAQRFKVPESLVRRVAWRESKFDQRQRHGPYWGLMQIRVDTARGLGFRGAPEDLLDADTNMSYAVAYLANAYRVAGRDEKRAVMLYASGYYYEAKRKGMLGSLIHTAAAEP
ncbi:lytic transglycosylase domain-containing protein [Ancylobacter lacus]|uniref:lytic transglycosylase domain-containing protein n=1 Tax=Ancylobacter lacus TaxID=2579970 RepID=UPI001BCF81C4|nr:lytic transglycosylase domain-containing protein [Ancylobacter lacus]MBS7541354.1 transglycosylase SLT domain-containing protein [Ancylobacter lacus]